MNLIYFKQKLGMKLQEGEIFYAEKHYIGPPFWRTYDYIMELKREIKRIPKNIKNIIDWIPVLWNNHSWDFSFFNEIILHKLKKDEKYFRNSHIIVDWEIVADEIREVIDNLEEYMNQTSSHELLIHYLKNGNNKYDGEWHELYGKNDERLEECRKKAFELINKNQRKWWD